MVSRIPYSLLRLVALSGRAAISDKCPLLRLEQTLRPPASMSPNDAVDGSSTRHVSAIDVGAAEAPTTRRS